MKKQLLSLTILGTMLASTTFPTKAVMDPNLPKPTTEVGVITSISPSSNYRIVINGQEIFAPTLSDLAYPSEDGDLMVPLRALSETLGYKVTWDSEKRSVEILRLPHFTTVSISKDSYFFARMAPQPLGEAPVIVDDHTYVPVTFFDEILKTTTDIDGTLISISNEQTDEITLQYDFKKDLHGFKVAYADLPVNADKNDTYELASGHKNIPVKDSSKKGIYIAGHNRSDDLFMYTYKKIGKEEGLKPNTTYEMELSFKLATNTPGSMMGIGGAPGESVFVKAGIVGKEPLPIIDDQDYYRLSVDKGNQSVGGKEVQLVGNITKVDGSSDDSFSYKSFKTTCTVETDAKGNAYIILGTDSGYEGKTDLYYTDIQVTFSK